ncbi:MAG: hypothetical protein ACLPSF_09415 [Methylocella sp.]
MISEFEGDCAVADAVDTVVDIRSEAAINAGGGKRDEVSINVRFHPDGSVNTIDALPRQFGRQEWFYRLCRAEDSKYQVFAGGRGRFRIQRDSFEAILIQNPN